MILRELPGFVAVEDAALLYGGGRLEQAAEQFIERHFHVKSADLDKFRLDNDVSIDPENLEKELQNHPQYLLSDLLSDDEIVSFLLEFGFDLRCSRGLPARCTKVIAAPVEAVARGLAGRVPDLADVETEKFEAKLQAEANAFYVKRHRKIVHSSKKR